MRQHRTQRDMENIKIKPISIRAALRQRYTTRHRHIHAAVGVIHRVDVFRGILPLSAGHTPVGHAFAIGARFIRSGIF
ncbi:hypothetical protein ACX80O_16035 [Arthrobacter sp. Hz1]